MRYLLPTQHAAEAPAQEMLRLQCPPLVRMSCCQKVNMRSTVQIQGVRDRQLRNAMSVDAVYQHRSTDAHASLHFYASNVFMFPSQRLAVHSLHDSSASSSSMKLERQEFRWSHFCFFNVSTPNISASQVAAEVASE